MLNQHLACPTHVDRHGEDGFATPSPNFIEMAARIRPSSCEEIVDAVKSAAKSGQGLLAVSSIDARRSAERAAGHGLTVIDLSGMANLIHADRRDKIVHIEPGVTFGNIDSLLAPHGMRAYRPLMPRAGKSLIASYLDREPLIQPNDHWDVGDPFGGALMVFGNGAVAPTGGAAIAGRRQEQLARGHRHMIPVGPINIDLLRIAQGAQGTLGIMAWAAVYCQPLPSLERAWFACSEDVEAVTGLARTLLQRRLGDVLFIADRTQLAMLLAADRAEFEHLVSKLPAWTLFVSLVAGHFAPKEKMAWQTADLERNASAERVTLVDAIGGIAAATLLYRLRHPARSNFRNMVRGAHGELFFLQQLDRAADFVPLVQAALTEVGLGSLPIGTYVQPAAQGVNCHVGFAVSYDPAAKGQREAVQKALGAAAERCARHGAFFSRPYEPWLDLAFRQGSDTAVLAGLAKATFDPSNIMNPGRFPYAMEAQ